jgi:hypothetical protein
MQDQNRKDDDTESEEDSSDDEGKKAKDLMFISAIDVGSHFIDVNPSTELRFDNVEGNLMGQFQISNPCKECHIAYFVYTSSPIPVRIIPNCGFIPASFSQPVKIVWERDQSPNVV